jgi:hypothetical protein
MLHPLAHEKFSLATRNSIVRQTTLFASYRVNARGRSLIIKIAILTWLHRVKRPSTVFNRIRPAVRQSHNDKRRMSSMTRKLEHAVIWPDA